MLLLINADSKEHHRLKRLKCAMKKQPFKRKQREGMSVSERPDVRQAEKQMNRHIVNEQMINPPTTSLHGCV